MLASGLLLTTSLAAFAEGGGPTDKVLSGKDDIEFATALREAGYPDLAQRLLEVVKKRPGAGKDADAAIKGLELDVAQDEARRIDDVVRRKDALVKVLRDKQKFVEEFKSTRAGEDVRNMLPDLYGVIGETFAAAIKREKDERALESLRAEGESLFAQGEEAGQKRVEEMASLPDKTEDDRMKWMAASYNACRLIYLHALLYSPGSGKRQELADKAIKAYDEFDLEFGGEESSLIPYFAMIDVGICQKELGKTKDALQSFDRAIAIRGEPSKAGVYELDRDIQDIVCYAMLQKMLALKEQKEFAKVAETGRDYLKTMKKPFDSGQAMSVAKELADAQIASGDAKGALGTAEMMIKEDPAGIGNAWGKDIQERLGKTLSYQDILQNADERIARSQFDAALALCRQALEQVAGTPEEPEAGCDILMKMGEIYERRRWFEEAAFAFQTAVDRYPRAKSAPDALLRAISDYSAANVGRRKYFRDLVDAATNRLVRDYPNAQGVSGIQSLKAENLEREGDNLGAIEIYRKVDAKSSDFTKAKLKIGICYFNHALKLIQQEKKPDEGKTFLPQAETAFKEAIAAIAAHPETHDPKVLSAYDAQLYLSTQSLARLYMLDAFGRIADADEVLKSLEKSSKWTSDARTGPEIQELRGTWYLKQNRVEDAEKWVQSLDPKARVGPAGKMARVFDEQGQAKHDEKKDAAAEELWKKAAKYYWDSIKPQVEGSMSQRPDEMKAVGDRLFVYGLLFSGVPDDRSTFVDWTPGTRKAPDYFTKAAAIYRAALTQSPDYRMQINLGRCLGFLGQWPECAEVYAKLFEQEPILNPKDKRKLDPAVTKAKPELTWAYIEWGVGEESGAGGDKEKLAHALGIFVPVCNSLRPEGTNAYPYWAATYHLVRTLMARGEYNDANLKIEDLRRQVSATFDDDKFGYKTRFEAASEELAKLLFLPKPAPVGGAK
jgi:tetratricopeptide (TPR) repeat protein